MPVLDFDQSGLGAGVQPPVSGGALDAPDAPIIPLLPRGQPPDGPGLNYACVRGYDGLRSVAGVSKPQSLDPCLVQGVLALAFLR